MYFEDFFDWLGYLVKNRLISSRVAYDFAGSHVISYWTKFKEVFIRQRTLYNIPAAYSNSEYLYNEVKRIRESEGHTIESRAIPQRYEPGRQAT